MAVRAIIYDFGGVLYRLPDRSMMRRWQRLLGLKNDPLISALIEEPEDSEYGRGIMTGRIPEAELWERLSQRTKVSKWILRGLRRRSFSMKHFNQELADFLSDLRPRIRTAILSNAGDEARRNFSEAYHLDRLVDLMVISGEEGIAKPEAAIFQRTLERLGVEPQEAIFLDDQPRNIIAAQELGIHGVLFNNNAQAIQEMQRLL